MGERVAPAHSRTRRPAPAILRRYSGPHLQNPEDSENDNGPALGGATDLHTTSDHSVGQDGMSTTRRRGSSPSEMVETPSISFTASCTTLRSADPIGSRAF